MNFCLSNLIDGLAFIRDLLTVPAVPRTQFGLRDVLFQLQSATCFEAMPEAHLGHEVERSVLNKRLRLAFHPLIQVSNGRLIGFEALLRLDAEVLRDVPPGIFIPLMEQSELICDVGKWVLDSTCRQLRQWLDQSVLTSDGRIAINLSARQFEQENLYAELYGILARHAIPPSMIEIEITESMLLEDSELTRANIKRLRQVGFAISVDDFGAGYSSLAYLKQFEFDNLKLDQSLVRHIADNANDRAIVAAVIKLAHRLGMRVIAEGVETGRQMTVLKNLECDFAQGYLFSRPMPGEKVAKFALQWAAGRNSRGEWDRQLHLV